MRSLLSSFPQAPHLRSGGFVIESESVLSSSSGCSYSDPSVNVRVESSFLASAPAVPEGPPFSKVRLYFVHWLKPCCNSGTATAQRRHGISFPSNCVAQLSRVNKNKTHQSKYRSSFGASSSNLRCMTGMFCFLSRNAGMY